MDLRLLVWNVGFGFRNERTKEFEENRLRLARSLVSEVNPDVFVIVEANGTTLQAYKEWFNYRNGAQVSWLGDKNKNKWGIVTLSKQEIDHSEERIFPAQQNREDKNKRKALRTNILVGNTSVTIDAIHPDPYTDVSKKIQGIDEMIDGSTLENHLIVGDGNCTSYLDSDELKKLNPAEFKSLRDKHIKYFSGRPLVMDSGRTGEEITDIFLAAEFMRHLKSRGYCDVFERFKRYPTIPTLSANPNPETEAKLDHIIAHQTIPVLHAEVLRSTSVEDPAEGASDHRPVFAKLRF